jgi:hypothetical protein
MKTGSTGTYRPWNIWAILSPSGELLKESCLCDSHYRSGKSFVELSFKSPSWVNDIELPEAGEQWIELTCQTCGYPTEQRESIEFPEDANDKDVNFV